MGQDAALHQDPSPCNFKRRFVHKSHVYIILAEKHSKHKIFSAYPSKINLALFFRSCSGLSFEQYLVVAKHQAMRFFQNILGLSSMSTPLSLKLKEK